jgi:hypothetical protein
LLVQQEYVKEYAVLCVLAGQVSPHAAKGLVEEFGAQLE